MKLLSRLLPVLFFLSTAISVPPLISSALAQDASRRSPVVTAVEKASPAVVSIISAQEVERGDNPFSGGDPFFDEFFRDFFEPFRQRQTEQSLGSGVVIQPDGYILTNEHVILRSGKIQVQFADERKFDARLVGADSDSDLAVLKVDSSKALPNLPLGNSDDLMIGETVIAIGNPFGLSHTVTTGVVSALNRSIRSDDKTYSDFIQTDASINPGNSGGPLLNIKGELIGIDTAIYSRSGGSIGIGFAIPVDRARHVMRDLVSYGEVRRAWVGLVVQDLTPQLAQHFGTRRGVVVTEIDPGSPAAGAGLARGDVITRVDGREVHSRDEFEQRVQDHAEGTKLLVTRRRDGSEEEVELVTAVFPAAQADDLAWHLLGLGVGEGDDGLVVRRVRDGSPAARIGVQRGDRLLGLGGAPLESLATFRKRMIELRSARSTLLSIGRGPYQYNVQVALAR